MISAALAAGEGRVAVCRVRSTAASMSFWVSWRMPWRGHSATLVAADADAEGEQQREAAAAGLPARLGGGRRGRGDAPSGGSSGRCGVPASAASSSGVRGERL